MATRTSIELWWRRAFVASLMVSLLFVGSIVVGQDYPVPDFRTSQYSPPVHIPPRVPLYDPGLPESLNGKFNSTQQIRSDQLASGTRAVIGDVSDSRAGRNYTVRQTRNGVDSNTIQGQRRRRAGLQDKISNLISSNRNRGNGNGGNGNGGNRGQRQTPVDIAAVQKTNVQNNRLIQNDSRPVQDARPIQQSRSIQKTGTVQQPAQHRLQRSITSAVYSLNPQRRLASLPVARQASGPRDNVYDRQSTNRRADGKHAQPSNSLEQMSVQVVDESSDSQETIQKAALQQPFDGDQPAFAEQVQGTNFGFGTPAQSQTTNSDSSSAWTAQSDQRGPESRLPSTVSRKLRPKPVSVLKKPDRELSLDTAPVNNNNFDFDAGEFLDANEFDPGENALREPFTQQEDDQLSIEPSSEDNDLSFDNGQDDDSQNPLRKSCEEFREQLLNRPITEIALDISPPAKTDMLGDNISRVWHDQNGVELAQGTIADLRQGYVVIDTGNGQVRLPYARLSDSDWLAISDFWRLPVECGPGSGNYADRCWSPQTVTWHASSLCHKPLYFENVQLERYGHSHGPFLQPIASFGHFFIRSFFVPYNTAINPPNECQYALGFYRPGNCAPWLRDPIPISLRGTARQVLVYGGLGSITN